MKRVDTVVSYGMLTPLAVAVLLLHGLLLQSMVSRVELAPASLVRTFSTRTIQSPPLAKAPLPRPVRKVVAAAPAAPRIGVSRRPDGATPPRRGRAGPRHGPGRVPPRVLSRRIIENRLAHSLLGKKTTRTETQTD